MNTWTVIAIGVATLAIIILIVQFIARNAVKTALGSLLAILASLVGALSSPELEGRANFDFHFGSWGALTGQWAKINSSRPLQLWYLPFITVCLLIIITLYFVHDLSVRQPGRPNF